MNTTARLSNIFVRAHHEVLTLAEHRLILAALRCLHTSDILLHEFRFPLREVIERVNGNGRLLIYEAIRKLSFRDFLGSLLFVELYVEEEANMVIGSFNPVQQQHLLYQQQLALGGFTQVDLSTTKFASVHSYRLYWLLSSYKAGTKQCFSLDEFRMLVLGDVTKYTGWTELNRSVLHLVREQFAEAGLAFIYQEERVDKSVVRIELTIPDFTKPRKAKKPLSETTAPAPAPSPPPPPGEDEWEVAIRPRTSYWNLYTRLKAKFGFDKGDAQYIIFWINNTSTIAKAERRLQMVNNMLAKVVEQTRYQKIENLVAYTHTSFKKVRNEVEAIESEEREKEELREDRQNPGVLATALAQTFSVK